MSAKDVADAILRDFRTSMADKSIYRFNNVASVQEVLDAIDEPDWLIIEWNGRLLSLEVCSAEERKLSV